ncbi:MAG: ABC transporter ATP-binding protein [Candidatus Methanomethylophilaceae archaeon]|nr:ABC transporter ATP-binding protein [Candidatus Methanomethylophilaceae archaeon]
MKVRVDNVGFSYGDTPVLRDVCFEALPGEITTIIGANGAGKTTLLKCIADLHKHKGDVYFDD